MSLWLTDAELFDLTRRQKPGWQLRQLDFMGIKYRRRSDGSLVVLWQDVRQPSQDALPAPREPRVRMEA